MAFSCAIVTDAAGDSIVGLIAKTELKREHIRCLWRVKESDVGLHDR